MKSHARLLLILLSCFFCGALATFLNGYLVEYLQVVTVFTLGGMLGVFVYLQWTRSEKEPLTERLTRRNLQEDLRASEERLNLVIEGTNDGIWDWDISTGKVFWSERANLLASNNSLGFGDSWDIIKKRLVVEDREKLEAALRGHLVGDVPFHIEVRLAMLDGKPRHLLLRGKAKRASDGKPSRMAGSVSDVTQRKSVEQELIYNAYHDSLTGVGNRKLFTDRLKHNIDRTIRRRDYLFSLLVLDVDNFKMINDTYGHSIGDKVLREIAMRIEDRCHSFEDRMVARIGGDVFGVLIGNVAKIEDIKSLVLRIEQDLSAPFVVENFKMSVSATIGIVFNGEKQESSEEMLSNADTVLQEAKRTPFDGRSRARVFDSPMRKKAQELYRLEQELRLAVENQDFFLVYQPIVNIQKGNRVVGFEALVRWNKDQGTEVQPCDFIPMAEDTGLILPMGKWILETACRQAKAWVDAGFHDVTVAVNFSARQFLNQDLANQVRCVLEETQLNPRNLKVEITESTAMREIERTIETLHSLTNMGLQISIDDFGTGYSNLSYLKHYPINTLKIDRSFVKDIPDDQEDMAITRTIISMANNLHLKIIAEGVETEAQLDFLRQEGCEQVQGYYFSRPLSRENATQYLKDYSSDAA